MSNDKLSEPPKDFCTWWNPNGTDEESGACTGGHPDARRVWARRDAQGWVRKSMGITAEQAWRQAQYRDEYQRWVDVDRPDRQPFLSVVTNEQQDQYAKTLAAILSKLRANLRAPAGEDEAARKRLLQQQKVELLNPPPPRKDDDVEPIEF
jgi:hypothetical protein